MNDIVSQEDKKALSPERKKALISLMRRAHILAGGPKLQTLSRMYTLEGIDYKHRDPVALNIKYAEWAKLPDSPENKSFWGWLERKYPEFCEREGLLYLNKHQREDYRFNIRDDFIYQGNSTEPFDTTKFLGKSPGFAAYVMDKNGKVYIGEHIVGKMHHSSFLSGEPVISAGMIKVEKGKITAINHHSGHYIPQKENLENFLLKINNNVFDDKAKIKFLDGDRSKLVKQFAESLINVRANTNYNWLPQRILIQLTKIGYYILRNNKKELFYNASSYYKDKLNERLEKNGINETKDTKETKDLNDDGIRIRI